MELFADIHSLRMNDYESPSMKVDDEGKEPVALRLEVVGWSIEIELDVPWFITYHRGYDPGETGR